MAPLQTSGKVETTLLTLAEDQPQKRVRAIIRVAPPPSSRRAEAENSGLVVHQVFRLVPGLAVEGAAADVVGLADRDWVHSIDLDREVTIRAS